MIKKALFILSLLLPTTLMAQLGVGSWQVFPTFQSVEQLVETPSKVYCLSAGSLMSYDMDNDETYNYGINNILTEVGVTNIYYNKYGKYLAVVYPSAGIDIIYDNGKMVSLPDIKDAILNVNPVINDIAFAPDRIYVATNFGVVVYNDQKMEVITTGMYEKNVSKIAATDNILLFTIDSNIYFNKTSNHINSLKNLQTLPSSNLGSVINNIVGISDNKFIVENSGNAKMFTYDYDTNTVNCGSPVGSSVSDLRPMKTGFYLAGSNSFVIFDENGDATTVAVPGLSGQKLAFWDDATRVWAGDDNGIAQYSFDAGGANLTMLHDKIKGDALTCTAVGLITVGPSGKIYVSRRGDCSTYYGYWQNVDICVNTIHNGDIEDVTFKINNSVPKSSYHIIEDPFDPDAYYIGILYGGVYKIKNGEVVKEIKRTELGTTHIYDIYDDSEGNVYVTSWAAGTNKSLFIHRLPANLVKSGSYTASDWELIHSEANFGEWNSYSTICKKSNIILNSARWKESMLFIDRESKVSKKISTFTDQDNKELSFSGIELINCFFEDSKGRIWVGYMGGVFIIPNPADFNNANFKIQRIKVPRNDGTNYADYLLDGENIICVTEDSQGRKWIGTQNSGAYLVNENGTEILEHFNMDNSYLSTNSVWDIACDRNSNAVYIGTEKGLLKYNSDAAPGADNYSDVYAFPNPVRPDYTGWITIKGLMDNSLVKIADAAGNVFYEGKSNGSIMTWDGCDAAGNRVKTGVYYVFASQTAEGSSKGAVAKILVVK